MMVSHQALTAMHAAVNVPTHADTLAHLHPPHTGSCRDHRTDRFVARYDGISAHPPVVVDNREIGMAEPAVFHGNLHLLGP
jgi:hypothetical protein